MNALKSSTGNGISLTAKGQAIVVFAVMILPMLGLDQWATAINENAPALIEASIAVVGVIMTIIGKARSNNILEAANTKNDDVKGGDQ